MASTRSFEIVISGRSATIDRRAEGRIVLIKYTLNSRRRLNDQTYMVKVTGIHAWPHDLSKDPLLLTAALVPYHDFCGAQKTIIGTSITTSNAYQQITSQYLPRHGWIALEHFSGAPISEQLISSLYILLRIVPASSVRDG